MKSGFLFDRGPLTIPYPQKGSKHPPGGSVWHADGIHGGRMICKKQRQILSNPDELS